MKQNFFNGKIDEMTNKKYGSWKLISWIKKRSLPATEVIQFNKWPYIKLDDLWETLYNSFNSAQNCQVNISLLNEIFDKEMTTFVSFSKKKLFSIIESCNNLLISRLDKLF